MQRVLIDRKSSRWLPIISGVPQSSLFGAASHSHFFLKADIFCCLLPPGIVGSVDSVIPCHRKYSQSECRKAVVYSSVFHRTFPSISAFQLHYNQPSHHALYFLWHATLSSGITVEYSRHSSFIFSLYTRSRKGLVINRVSIFIIFVSHKQQSRTKPVEIKTYQSHSPQTAMRKRQPLPRNASSQPPVSKLLFVFFFCKIFFATKHDSRTKQH